MNAYHFTDTLHLPHILFEGSLRPGRNTVGGFPDPDFVWSTMRAEGDHTATAYSDLYRDGGAMLVRFSFPVEEFHPWENVVDRFPSWTHEHVARLEKAAQGKSNPRDWLIRETPISIKRANAVHIRSYRGGWVELNPLPFPYMQIDGVVNFELAGWIYFSQKIESAGRPTMYAGGREPVRL